MTLIAEEAASRAWGNGTADELLALQRVAQRNVVFSVTRRCPLQCSHCITSSGPRTGGVMPASVAGRLAGELPALRADGVEHVTFTGGEPVLALAAVRILSAAASAAGMQTSIVTGGGWARTPRVTARVIESLASIGHWDVGFDAFHEEAVTFAQLSALLQALFARGRSCSVRVCVGEPPSARDLALLARLAALLGDRVPVYQQTVRRAGRAQDTLVPLSRPTGRSLPAEPCLSSGLLVREDGSTGPCCSALAYDKRGLHPFDYGNVAQGSLLSARKAWLSDPLLRLIRLTGFSIPLQWLAEEGIGTPAIGGMKTCELCAALWDPEGVVGAALRARASRPAVVAKLAELESHLFA